MIIDRDVIRQILKRIGQVDKFDLWKDSVVEPALVEIEKIIENEIAEAKKGQQK